MSFDDWRYQATSETISIDYDHASCFSRVDLKEPPAQLRMTSDATIEELLGRYPEGKKIALILSISKEDNNDNQSSKSMARNLQTSQQKKKTKKR